MLGVLERSPDLDEVAFAQLVRATRKVEAVLAELPGLVADLPYAGQLEKIPNSRRSLILGELAREKGLFDALHPRLFAAYWAEGRDIGDQQVLVEKGVSAGLTEDEVRGAFDDQRFEERVEAHTEAAVELGAGGVPAWLIDGRVLVPGAQPHDLFERVLDRLGHTPRV